MKKKNIEKNNKTSKEKNQNIGLTIKLCKKITIFALLETTIMIAAIGCGSVKEGTATPTDADAEVTDADTTEENTEVVSWIAETEKEKALVRQETYEVVGVDGTDAESLTAGTYDTSTGETEVTEENTDSSTTGISNSGSALKNSSSDSSSLGSSGSSGKASDNSSSSGSGSSSNNSTSSSSKSTSCSHNWTLTGTKAEEGYYKYTCTSSSYGSGHTARRCVCNRCGYVCETSSEMNAHFKETIAYAQANYDDEVEQATHTCGNFTIYSNYKIDNIAWVTGTATKTWVSTSAGTYTYTCSKCGETKTESFTENHSASSISFTIDPYNGEDVDSWLNSHYN